MNAKKLSECVLKKIKQENIKPRPCWIFGLRNSVFWILFAISAIYGGRVIGVMLYMMNEVEPDMLMKAHGPALKHFLHMLPLVWIIFFLLLFIAATYGLHYTKKGYKISAPKLLAINLGISLLIGGSAFAIGDAEDFEETMHHRLSFFERIEDGRRKAWSNPQEGRLSGIVIEVRENEILLLNDFTDRRWTVDYSDSEHRPGFNAQVEMMLRIVGQQMNEQTFVAEVIGPWRKGGKKAKKAFRKKSERKR